MLAVLELDSLWDWRHVSVLYDTHPFHCVSVHMLLCKTNMTTM